MRDTNTEELTEFQIVWCVVVAIAVGVLFMDLFVWRP